jgi:hypothetical protein
MFSGGGATNPKPDEKGVEMQKAMWIAGGILIAAAGLFLVFESADLFAQEGPPGGGGPGGRGGFPGRMSRMGGGGGAAMTVVGTHLFVFSGNTLFKVDPVKMEIVKTLELKPEGQDRPKDDRRGSGRRGW